MIRHAEAEGNTYRRAHGQFNGLLSGRGHKQIQLLKERFLNEKIDAIYSSDFDRTCITAAAISEIRGLAIYTDERLREVNVGEWEDVAWGDLNHNFPEMSDLFGSDPARWSVNGSEKYEHVRERMKQCLIDIGRRHDGQTVAAFSHGFAIRALTCELLGIPSHETHLVPYCDNTAVALLLFENDEFSIEFHSDNSHLAGGQSTFAGQTWWREKKDRRSEDIRYVPLEEAGLGDSPEQSGKSLRFSALLEDLPVGSLELDTARDSNEKAGWIASIIIKPEFRRIGYGVQLLGQAVSVFRKLGREKLRLEAEPDSPLMMFCLKYGFVENGSSGRLRLMEKNIKNW